MKLVAPLVKAYLRKNKNIRQAEEKGKKAEWETTQGTARVEEEELHGGADIHSSASGDWKKDSVIIFVFDAHYADLF